MVLVKSPTDFVTKSLELLQARPSTTRVTTTYNVSSKSLPSKSTTTTTTDAPKDTKEKDTTPRGTMTLKTYDPVSGAMVKYKTNKLADVGRLVAGLSRLGRGMAGLADVEPETVVEGTGTGEVHAQTDGPSTPVPTTQKPAGKKGKKKGKK